MMYPKAASAAVAVGLMLAGASHGSPLAARLGGEQLEAWEVDDDSYNIVVGCDVPDGDNYPEIVHTLLATDKDTAQPLSRRGLLGGDDKRKIAIVLEGREVNFGALHFSQARGENGETLATQVGAQKDSPSVITELFERVGAAALKDKAGIDFFVPFFWMVSVYDQAWARLIKLVESDSKLAQQTPKFLKTWFEIGNASEDKRKAAVDEQIYMQVSKIRLIKMLDSFGIDRERYQIWTKAANNRLKPGIKPAQHVQDWRWGLSKEGAEAVAKCQSSEDPHLPVSEKRADCVRRALRSFADDFNSANGNIAPLLTLREEADSQKWGETFTNYFDNRVDKYRYLLGGPVSVLQDHLKSPGRTEVTQAVAMLQSFVPDINVLLVQYNHYIDQDASKYTMDQAVQGNFEYYLSPTEIVKRSPYTFRFEKHNGRNMGEITMENAFGADNPIYKLEDDFTAASLLPANLFDMHAGIYAFRPDLYPKAVRVEYEEDKSIKYNGVPFIRLKKAGPLSKSKLYVLGADLIEMDKSNEAYDLIHKENGPSNSKFGPAQGVVQQALGPINKEMKSTQDKMIEYLQSVFKNPDFPFKKSSFAKDDRKGYFTEEAFVPIAPFLGNLA